MTKSTAQSSNVVANGEQKVLRSFLVPLKFKNILTTVVINHPDYKNTKEFIIDCIEYGFNEIKQDLNETDLIDLSHKPTSAKLSKNIEKELADFLKANTVESIINDEKDEVGISWNMNKNFFLQLKSKIPLSKYKELRVFYINQVYNGLKRLLAT